MTPSFAEGIFFFEALLATAIGGSIASVPYNLVKEIMERLHALA